MRFPNFLPVLLVAACAGCVKKPEEPKPTVIFQAPGKTARMVEPNANVPMPGPQAPSSTLTGQDPGIRWGGGVSQMPDENEFKASNPNLTHKNGDGAVVVHPPGEKQADPATKPPKE